MKNIKKLVLNLESEFKKEFEMNNKNYDISFHEGLGGYATFLLLKGNDDHLFESVLHKILGRVYYCEQPETLSDASLLFFLMLERNIIKYKDVDFIFDYIDYIVNQKSYSFLTNLKNFRTIFYINYRIQQFGNVLKPLTRDLFIELLLDAGLCILEESKNSRYVNEGYLTHRVLGFNGVEILCSLTESLLCSSGVSIALARHEALSMISGEINNSLEMTYFHCIESILEIKKNNPHYFFEHSSKFKYALMNLIIASKYFTSSSELSSIKSCLSMYMDLLKYREKLSSFNNSLNLKFELKCALRSFNDVMDTKLSRRTIFFLLNQYNGLHPHLENIGDKMGFFGKVGLAISLLLTTERIPIEIGEYLTFAPMEVEKSDLH